MIYCYPVIQFTVKWQVKPLLEINESGGLTIISYTHDLSLRSFLQPYL